MQVTWEAIEAAFWEIVEEGEESIDVIYGADLDSTQLGSGFPRAGGRMANNEYAAAMWNLNNFPRLQGVLPSPLCSHAPAVQTPFFEDVRGSRCLCINASRSVESCMKWHSETSLLRCILCPM